MCVFMQNCICPCGLGLLLLATHRTIQPLYGNNCLHLGDALYRVQNAFLFIFLLETQELALSKNL